MILLPSGEVLLTVLGAEKMSKSSTVGSRLLGMEVNSFLICRPY